MTGEGGAGGGGTSFLNGAALAGGTGGLDYSYFSTGNNGLPGQPQGASGGGGGGAGLLSGFAGGGGNNSSDSHATIGGAAGTPSSAGGNGQDSVTYPGYGGGGGGGGAAGAIVSGVAFNAAVINGSNGGAGGAYLFSSYGGGGGGGGAGGMGVYVSSNTSFTNSGSITGGTGGAGGNTVGTAGGYSGGGGSGGVGAYLANGSSLINSGTIQGANGALAGVAPTLARSGQAGQAGSGVYLESGSVQITNIGTILGGGSANISGIQNNGGVISVLNNMQGVGNVNGPLSYSGNLPSNYNIIIGGPNQYGQFKAIGQIFGPMAFNIYGNANTSLVGGVSASTVAVGTYYDVLQGFSSLSYVTGARGTYGGLRYSLVADPLHSGDWNLVFVPGSANILSGATNLLSGLGGSLNPVFDGGILKIDSAGTSAANFTITSNNGKIDQNSLVTNFSGNITNSGTGVSGKLTIVNSGVGGSVILSGNNTYSGGTEVDAGANLSISSVHNIGSGPLTLVGSSTTPATLTTTAKVTLANSITVTADPVFNVAAGTTTTVTNPIADGASSGDVVVQGGGTLALTAANSYTGLTNINAGSTLALVGAGSITNSSALNNSGTVDVRGANGNVVLGGTFTQTSTGNLLMNISPTNNQQLNVTGAAALAGGLSLNATAGTYAAGKYTLLTANGVTGIFGTFASNLSSYTRLGYALGYDANDVYLYLTPNVADSQQSLVNNASALQNIYTLQNTVLANSFSYDCNVFGENDVCVSAGGRNTAVSAANGLNNTSALLIASYRLDESNSRVGAYADQNLSMNQAGNTVNLGNNTPLMGLFAAWNENADGTGAEVKAGIAYGQKNASVTRQVVGTSEPGTGSSQLNSQGAQITAKYGFALDGQIIVSPYIGMRYTQNNMGGYTEATSASVTSPLTYAALNTNATTALAGVGASYHFIPEVNLFASAGVETDTNTANGTYSATGLAGLTPINFNANPVKTRPTAMLGASYDVEKNQRIGITGIYRQEAFQAVSTTSVMATYTVGF